MINAVRRWWSWMIESPAPSRSVAQIIAWWERRRLSYNAFLVIVGVPSVLVFYAASGAAHTVAPGHDAVEPMMLIVTPVLANVAYTAGWVVEAFGFRKVAGPSLAPWLMRTGLIFSSIVIVLPALGWSVIAITRMVTP